MRSSISLAVIVVAGLFAAQFASAQTAPSTESVAGAPSTQPASGAMKVYITEVKGLVQVRDGEADAWRAAKAQMIISQGAELRTGPHSSVTCVIPPDQTFTLDRLGTVRVEEAARHGDKITTDLIMKYGRTRYDIEAAGLEHEASIISPSSTLAVRGTNVSLYDQPPFIPEAVSYTGRAAFTNGKNTVAVGTKSGTFAKALAGTDGASQTGVNETVVDPAYGPSRTPTDAALISSEVSRGAVLSYDAIANIPVITNGRPLTDSQLPSQLPGALNFVLRWTGNVDLNIEVGVSKGDPLTILSTTGFVLNEFLYPGFGYQNSASGGHIAFDNRGGPNGGEEIAYWTGKIPPGLYGIAAQSESATTATSFTFNVFANGVPLEMFYFAPDGVTEVKSTQVTHILQPGQSDTAIIPVPDLPLLDGLPDDPAGNPNPGINLVHASAAKGVAVKSAAQPAPAPAPTKPLIRGGTR
jgi:hypothetical protein